MKKKRTYYRSSKIVQDKSIKKNKKANWFKKGKNGSQFKSVIFVDATPNDSLIKRLRSTESKYRISDKCRIKFVSKSGIKLKNVLKRKHVVEEQCSNDDGMPCVNSNGEPIKDLSAERTELAICVSVKLVI